MLSNTGSSSDDDDAQEESLSISGGVPADIRGTGLRASMCANYCCLRINIAGVFMLFLLLLLMLMLFLLFLFFSVAVHVVLAVK